MSQTSRVVSMCLVGLLLMLDGCIPNSFRIDSADSLHHRILYPPGAEHNHEKLVLYVETPALLCQKALPTLKSNPITLSTAYWHAVGSRVVRIELPRDAKKVIIPPPAACLNRAVRPAPDECPQDYIVDEILSAIQKDAEWNQCVARNARTQLIADVSEVLPHRASESGALREERTYQHPPVGVTSLNTEVVRLMPGAIVCANRDYTLVYGNPTAWASSEACSRLLEAPDASGRVVLSRTDEERMFPLARHSYGQVEAKIYEARSWQAVRGTLAALMPSGAFLYVYYSGNGNHNVQNPDDARWESREYDSVRAYPKGMVEPTIHLTPILVAHSEPLVLEGDTVPSLEALCKADSDQQVPIERRCFTFPDLASIDVLRPFSVDGHTHYAPSGTLTTDIPEIAWSRHHSAKRLFRGRIVPMAFDITKTWNAVPLAAGDQFGGR